MSADERDRDALIAPTLLTCRIIGGALVFGVLAFATLVIVLRLGEPAEDEALVSLIGAGVAFLAVVARQVVVGVMGGRTASGTAGSPAAGALGLYVTRLIVGLAILEGACFFNLIAYMLEGHWWSLLVVAGLLAWMIASFPTTTRLRQWIEDREQLREIGGGRT